MNGSTNTVIPSPGLSGGVDQPRSDVADRGNPFRARLRRALGILAIIVSMTVLADALGLWRSPA